MATWNPIDKSYSNCPILPWRVMTWRQRIVAIVFNAISWGVIFPIAAIMMLAVIGMIIEGLGQSSEQADICRRQATTPYAYHQCR